MVKKRKTTKVLFGSVKWQQQQLNKINKKFKAGKPLSGQERIYMSLQIKSGRIKPKIIKKRWI